MGAAQMLRMEGVETLKGDLILSGNPELGGFSAPNLKLVDGQIKIENQTILSKAEFPQLTQVKSMTLSVLPALEIIQFPAGLTKVDNMKIEDTRAPKIDGFKPEMIGTFTLNNNNYMRSFDFSSVKEANEIYVHGNNHGMSFDAPNLTALNKAIFFNLAQIQVPSLTAVRSDLSFHENEFSSLNMDALQSIGGTFTMANNNKLTGTSFKNLNLIVGALSIGNNTQLATIEGFPSLAEIHGTCDLAGNFDDYKLPALKDVRGGMRIQSTSSKLACPELERKLKGEGIVKGTTWSCSANMQQEEMVPTVGQTPPTVDGNNSGKIIFDKGSSPPTKNGNGSGSTQGREKENISITNDAPTSFGSTSLGLAITAYLVSILF
ncbi:hypothetical protein G6F22_007465 [Rhizopus arrhizus]|nr:hypothetical protein G6F22_007465 [Rhizopus arrhizus]KAG1224086.1 hypothetical protein G6F35_004245 [Rhizopus arrhizus]